MSGTDQLQEISDLVKWLVDPYVHGESVVYWDHNRNKKIRVHCTKMPSLMSQLHRAAVEPLRVVDESVTSRSKPASRPPLALEAYSRWLEIRAGVRTWCETLAITSRPTLRADLRAIVGVFSQLDLDTRDAIIRDLTLWKHWARVMTGWESEVFTPQILCPACESEGSLRVNMAEYLAYCDECSHTWERDTLVEMAKESAIRMAA